MNKLHIAIVALLIIAQSGMAGRINHGGYSESKVTKISDDDLNKKYTKNCDEEKQANDNYTIAKRAFCECTEKYPYYWAHLNGTYSDVRWGYPCHEEQYKAVRAEKIYIKKVRCLEKIIKEMNRRQKQYELCETDSIVCTT